MYHSWTGVISGSELICVLQLPHISLVTLCVTVGPKQRHDTLINNLYLMFHVSVFYHELYNNSFIHHLSY